MVDKETQSRAGFEAAAEVREETRQKMEQKGLGFDRLLDKLASKINAKETKLFAHQGVIVDREDLEAHRIQLDAVDMALRVGDYYPANRHEVDIRGGDFAVQLEEAIQRRKRGEEIIET